MATMTIISNSDKIPFKKQFIKKSVDSSFTPEREKFFHIHM